MLYSFYSYCSIRHIIAIMAKRSMEETLEENSKSDFSYDDSENEFRKKIKLETDLIIDKIQDIEQEIDISEHEVHKFLLIYHTLVQIINSEEPQEQTDGFIADTILQIVNVIAGLLKNNIDKLNIPAVLKSALKKLKSLFTSKTKDSEEGKPGNPEPEIAQLSNKTQKTSEASRDG